MDRSLCPDLYIDASTLFQGSMDYFCHRQLTDSPAGNIGRATDIIYLDLCKVFDTVPHDILVANWRKMDFMDEPLAV